MSTLELPRCIKKVIGVKDTGHGTAQQGPSVRPVDRRTVPYAAVAIQKFGYCFGYCLVQKAQKTLKRPANERSWSLSFLSTDSKRCEEFRSGQEKQIAGFESAAYDNFATPARTSDQRNILQINASTEHRTPTCLQWDAADFYI